MNKNIINILVTRPVNISSAFSMDLGNKYNIINYPFLKIETVESEYDNLDSYDGLVFTSKIAAQLFNYNNIIDIPVFAVGKATAAKLYDKDFNNIISGNSDVRELGNNIINNVNKGSRLLHICGDHIAGNLQQHLSQYDITLDKLVIYKSIKINKLDDNIINLFKNNKIDIITLYSPRTAQSLKSMIDKYELEQYMINIKCLCFSEMVLNSVKEIKWKSSHISKNCNEESMIKLIRDLT